MPKKSKVQSYQDRITELEQQLAAAQATILSLQAKKGQISSAKPTKITEESWFSSDEGFKEALLIAPYPLMIWREEGTILMVNDAFTKISGYALEDIPTIEDWAHKAFGDRFLEQPSLIFYEEFPGQDVKKSREFEITTRTGGKRIWDFSYAVLGTDQKNRWLMLTMAVDITERREIEGQLEENERKFTIIFDKAPFAAALSRLPDGIITHVNEEFERLFGYPRQDILGRTSLETGINPDPEARARILAQIQSQGSARNVESHLYTKSGELRICLLNLDQVHIGGQKYVLQTAQDITERKRADESLKEMTRLLELDRARLNTILEHLPVGVWISDQDGRLVGKNAQADRIWAGNAPLLEVVEDYQQYQSWDARTGLPLQNEEYPMAMALRTGRPVEPVELNIRRFDGTTGTVLVSAAPIKDDQNRLTGAVAVNVDITDRKRSEQQLGDSEERFSKAFHKSPFGMNITRVRDGAILDVNDAWLDLLGWTREEILGKTTAEFPFYARLEDRQWVRERITKEEVPGDMEIHVVRKDGTELVVNVATTIIELQGERCILGVLNDITERKRAEQALQESEQRYRGLFERMQEGLVAGEVITDKDGKPVDYRYIDVNPAIERQYGLQRERFIGRKYTEVLPEGDKSWVEFLGGVGLTGKPASIERYSQVSGKWFEAHAYSPRPGQFVNILTDITERKNAENALRQSEERFSKAFHSSPDAIAISRLSDGLLIDVNDGWVDLFGFDRDEVVGLRSLDLKLIANPEARQEVLRRMQEQGSIKNFVLEIRRKSGELRLVDLSSEKIQVNGEDALLSVLRDITEQKKVERALQESEARFRSLADSMPQLVWTALPDGRVDYYNKRHLEYQDIKQVKDLDWDWAPVLHADDSQATVDAWLHALETGETYQIEHRVRMTDGSYRWHLSRGVPMLDEKGGIIRWFGTATDIHDLKLAEEQLKIYAGKLEKSNLELEQFAFMASHDLQEPLRKIEMFGDLLLERATDLQDNERNYLNRMRNSASRMRDMIEGLLQISRVATQGRPFVQVDLSRITFEVLSDFEEQIQRSDGKVEINSLPLVTGDPLQLRQLMQNLVGNALKYRQPGRPPEVRIYASQFFDKVQICVEDKGIGFALEDADRIFEPFHRLVGRNQYEGSGIGLAICRRIVERHGGEIAAISEPGKGTTFIVTLPDPASKQSQKDS